MKLWLVLWRKETLELWRSYRWLWMPLVFVALGMMQPAATYYMPQLIDSLGGLPEGAVIEIPTPSPGGVLAESLGQFNTIGILVLVLGSMGMVANERNSGAAALLLVKPVSFGAYVSAKWAAYTLLMLASVGLGQIAAWYYTMVLFDAVPVADLVTSTLAFALWLAFVLTALVLASVFVRAAALVAAVTIGVAILLGVLTQVFGDAAAWSPSNLVAWANARLTGGDPPSLALPLGATMALIAVMLAAAIFAFPRRPLTV